MLYIHQAEAISPQKSFSDILSGNISALSNNQLKVIEPAYSGVPKNLLRRMGKAVRIGVGASISCLQRSGQVPGIIIGTGYGGMEESISFLKQIMDYNEGMLTAGNFVQSTANATAAQISLMSSNQNYNITHVHRGLAFENAVIDAAMMLKENPGHTYLVGGVDEISPYNFMLESLAGLYKNETVNCAELYQSITAGTIAGEGAAMFLVTDQPENAIAKLEAVRTIHSRDVQAIKNALSEFLQLHSLSQIDLLITGENGDNRQLPFYQAAEALMKPGTAIARFKHLCGEYPTAAAFGIWLSLQLLNETVIPQHMVKKKGSTNPIKTILIYNCYNFEQHSFTLICS